MDELKHYGVLGMKWGVRRNRRVRRSDNYHEDYKKAHSRKSVKYMSNDELRERNKRLNAEVEYARLKSQTSLGQQAVKKFIAGAGTITAVTAAYATYKKVGGTASGVVDKALDKVVDAIGNVVLKDLKF